MASEEEGTQTKPRLPLGLSPLALGLLAALTLAALTYFGSCITSLVVGSERREEAHSRVHQFMKVMSARQPEVAETLFSRNQDPVALHKGVTDLLTGQNYVLFEGYQNLAIEGFFSKTSIGCTTPNQLNVQGSISYADGSRGRFTASLVEEGGGLALMSVNVTVPPSKFVKPP